MQGRPIENWNPEAWLKAAEPEDDGDRGRPDAHNHKIPVYGTRDALQTRLAGKVFGPRTATIFVGGALLTGSLFSFFIYGLVTLGVTGTWVAGSAFTGSFFLLFLYGALTARRAYCSHCGGFRLVYRRKGNLRCEECEGVLTPNRGG